MGTESFDGSGIRTRGGVSSLRLLPVSGIKAITLKEGRIGGIELHEGVRWLSFGFTEDSAEYSERYAVKDGATLATHRLTFRFGIRCAEASKAIDSLASMSEQGIVALITTEAGETIVAGYSERLGLERPLRMADSSSTSAKTPHEAPYTQITLSCTDTAAAMSAHSDFQQP